MNYITVKLTEDQVKAIEEMISERFELLRDFPNGSKEEAAFLRRLDYTLAKAKNE